MGHLRHKPPQPSSKSRIVLKTRAWVTTKCGKVVATRVCALFSNESELPQRNPNQGLYSSKVYLNYKT